jgi:hypothetical protein
MLLELPRCVLCVMSCLHHDCVQDELARLTAGQLKERVPARLGNSRSSSSDFAAPKRPDPYEGTWETLSLEDGQPFLDRHDVWGWNPGSNSRPAGMRGFRLDG